MRPIAIRLVVAVLTLAEENGLGLLRLENDGPELRRLVVTVAKRLFLRKPASAPGVVFTRLQVHFGGKLKSNVRFGQ
jgi:hypothetical protein